MQREDLISKCFISVFFTLSLYNKIVISLFNWSSRAITWSFLVEMKFTKGQKWLLFIRNAASHFTKTFPVQDLKQYNRIYIKVSLSDSYQAIFIFQINFLFYIKAVNYSVSIKTVIFWRILINKGVLCLDILCELEVFGAKAILFARHILQSNKFYWRNNFIFLHSNGSDR